MQVSLMVWNYVRIDSYHLSVVSIDSEKYEYKIMVCGILLVVGKYDIFYLVLCLVVIRVVSVIWMELVSKF